MRINVAFDPSISSAPPALVDVINYVVGLYEATFANNVTLNLAFGWGEIGGEILPTALLGESDTPFIQNIGIGQIRAAGASLATAGDPILQSALPSGVSNSSVALTSANAKALGFLPAADAGIDGYIGIKANPNVFNFSLSTATPGDLQDLVGVVEHEITEVMGRTSGLDGDNGGNLLLLDQFRYQAPDKLNDFVGPDAYFSIDHGATSLIGFNTNAKGDLGDWAGGGDAFQSFYRFGPAPLSSADLITMAALGWIDVPMAQARAEFVAFPSGGEAAGKATIIGVDFNTAVSGSGTPSLTLANGDTANYLSGLGGHVLLFSYTPSHALTDAVALTPTALNLNGGTLTNALSAPANLSLTALGLDVYDSVTVAGSDIVLSGAKTSVFLVAAGGAAIAGALGMNTAVFTGSLAQYVIAESNGVVTVTDGLPARDGTSTLTNVQQARFSDYTVVFDLHSRQDLLVYQLYQAAYGRTPDNAGFRYWATMADAAGSSALALADQFLQSAEFARMYGTHPSMSQYVTELYGHVLGRAADAAGMNYWVGMANGGMTQDQLLFNFATSAENVQMIGPHVANGYWTAH